MACMVFHVDYCVFNFAVVYILLKKATFNIRYMCSCILRFHVLPSLNKDFICIIIYIFFSFQFVVGTSLAATMVIS